MEILTPVNNEDILEEKYEIPKDILGENINMKNLQFLNYLGLKDEMMNGKIMEKVAFLSDNLGIDELMHLDFKVGQDPHMPRLDRIYSYLKLDMMSRSKKDELNMINEAKSKWEL